jgi:hypothetical protein
MEFNNSLFKKLLEEKKNIEKKSLEQKKANSISKEAALAFLEQQKKERQLKIEQEAQELLEKRRQKLEQESNFKKPSNNLAQQPTSSKILKNNNLTNSSNGNANKSSISSKQPSSSIKTSKNSNLSNNNSLKTPSILKNDTSKNSNTQTSKPSISSKPSTSSKNPQKPKPKLTFEDMLKLAEQKEKEVKANSGNLMQKKIKPSSTSSLSETKSISSIITQSINQIKKLPKSEISKEIPICKNIDKTNDSRKDKVNLNDNTSNNNNVIKKQKPIDQSSNSNKQLNNPSSNSISKLRPEQIEKLRQREQISTGNKRPKSESFGISGNNNCNRQTENSSTKNMSAWDRAVADIKKKTTSKL